LIAISPIGELGVDVESVREVKDVEALVKRFFSVKESELFQQLAPELRPAAFFNLWTRKEAMLKATGVGITGGLHEIEVSFLNADPARVLAITGDPEKASEWRLQHLTPALEFVGAVAIQCRKFRIAQWRWTGIRTRRREDQ
jgi:4'-phosphopantetheinyl transferase